MTMYVVTHKHFDYRGLPKDYVPLLVGAFNKKNLDDFLTDNEGENISNKNASYCEETGLFWMWKHAKKKNIGLSHYRRFFTPYRNRKMMYLKILFYGKADVISVSMLDKLLNDGYQWVVSQPEHGGDGTLWNQFAENHHINDLEITGKVIKHLTPEYYDAFNQVLKKRTTNSFYNMFYTTRNQMNAYCNWLFKILFEVEKETDISGYSNYQKRLYGFLAERLLNVWLFQNQPKIKYLPVFEVETMNRKYALKMFKNYFHSL